MPTPERAEAAPATSAATQRPTTLRANALSALAGVLVVALGIAGVMWLSSSDDNPKRTATQSPSSTTTKATATPKAPAGLIESTTHSTLRGLPLDPAPGSRTEGRIVRPTKVIKIYDAPSGKPRGKIGPNQIGETWLPKINERGGWVQVLLPSKPNGSTGWIRTAHVEEKVTPYLISVHLKSMRLRLYFEGGEVGDWKIGIGKPGTPTPTGRTFVLGSIVDPNQKYSPVILPLGSHSATLNSFGGGPGTVAIHTWPTTDVLGTATSHGCIRVPKEALNRLTQVPLGTLVLVDKQ